MCIFFIFFLQCLTCIFLPFSCIRWHVSPLRYPDTAQRGRKNDFTASSTSNCNNSNDTPLGKLLNGLRWLSSEMYFGEWAGKSGPDFPFHVVAHRVRSLVVEFQRFAAMGLLTMPERTEGWRQVVRFLVLLRTVGLTEVAPNEDVDPGCHHRGDDNQQSIDGVGRSRTNHKSKVSASKSKEVTIAGGIISNLPVCQTMFCRILRRAAMRCETYIEFNKPQKLPFVAGCVLFCLLLSAQQNSGKSFN